MVKKYGELFMIARRALLSSEGENAALYARLLLCKLSGKTMPQLIADRDEDATEQIEREMENALRQMQAGKPLAYILGTWSFYGLELAVTQDVLIPRDDTMAVTDLAISKLRAMPLNARVLDLCTGSGCIGLAIAHEVPSARLTLVDASAKALSVCKQNVHKLKMTARVSCFEGDALASPPAFWGSFDLIVSNPPYVTKAELSVLPVSVKDYEPLMALDGGEDGLDFFRAIIQNYKSALRCGGWLLFEFGMGQEAAVGQLLEAADFVNISFVKDHRGVIRAVCAKKPE